MIKDAESVRAWTIQRAGWWTLLQQQGQLGGNASYVDADLHPAYRWLMSQMERRLPNYRGGWPVWFWYQPKPDLRRAAHLPRGEPGVRLELALPRRDILLLDFQAWHCVLNDGYLALTEEGEDKRGERAQAQPAGEVERQKRRSWEWVFELDALRQSGSWGPVDTIQGVIESVNARQVRRVCPFVAR